jgi:hypothetical protein
MKRYNTIIIGVLILCSCIPAIHALSLFYDNAETGNYSSNGWVPATGFSSYCTNRAYEGNHSICLNGTLDAYYANSYSADLSNEDNDSFANATAEVWYYDDGNTSCPSAAAVCRDRFDIGNYGTGDSVVIGIVMNDTVRNISWLNNYAYYHGDNTYVQSSVLRTVGWHRFTIYINAAKTGGTLYIDKHQIYNGIFSTFFSTTQNKITLSADRPFTTFDNVTVYRGSPTFTPINDFSNSTGGCTAGGTNYTTDVICNPDTNASLIARMYGHQLKPNRAGVSLVNISVVSTITNCMLFDDSGGTTALLNVTASGGICQMNYSLSFGTQYRLVTGAYGLYTDTYCSGSVTAPTNTTNIYYIQPISLENIGNTWNLYGSITYNPYGIVNIVSSTSGGGVCEYPAFNVTNTSLTNASILISSTATLASNMTVCYGTSENLGVCTSNTTNVTTVTLNISGLSSSTAYKYNVTRTATGGAYTQQGYYDFATLTNTGGSANPIINTVSINSSALNGTTTEGIKLILYANVSDTIGVTLHYNYSISNSTDIIYSASIIDAINNTVHNFANYTIYENGTYSFILNVSSISGSATSTSNNITLTVYPGTPTCDSWDCSTSGITQAAIILFLFLLPFIIMAIGALIRMPVVVSLGGLVLCIIPWIMKVIMLPTFLKITFVIIGLIIAFGALRNNGK